MKPLYTLNDTNKETLFNLQVYDVINKIEEKANEWFEETYINKKDYIPSEILLRNFLDNINYMISEGIWWIELGESMGFNMDSKRFLQTMYDHYTGSHHGYRFLVRDPRYDPHNNKVLTQDEMDQRDRNSSEIMNGIIEEMKREGAFDKK